MSCIKPYLLILFVINSNASFSPFKNLSKCSTNEVFKSCSKECAPDSCMKKYFEFKCIGNEKCKPSCVCKDKYLRHNGKCIPQEECPPAECVHDQNAVLGRYNRFNNTCYNYNLNKTYLDNYVKGCSCREKYVYDKNLDLCVLPEKCTLQCTMPYEVYIKCLHKECGPKTCNDLRKPKKQCHRNNSPCKNGCICVPGYVRNANNECILEEKCPSINCTQKYEVWSSCSSPCSSQYCHDLINPAKSCTDLTEHCIPRCVCKDGFSRNNDGWCIPTEECPSILCIDKNEIWDSCTSPCLAESCESILQKSKTCYNTSEHCIPRCICKKGFSRNNDGLCIPTAKYPLIECTQENEIWYSCTSPCLQENCKDILNKSYKCTNTTEYCIPKCVCKEGFSRNNVGICVPTVTCPSVLCAKENEVWHSCTSPCLTESFRDLIDKSNTCTNVTDQCISKCVCIDGFFRNDDGLCVPMLSCPSVICTQENEVWNFCSSFCLAESCQNLFNQSNACTNVTEHCVPRCVCNEGYSRNNDDLCIPTVTCPEYCNDPNSHYSECASDCPATCDRKYQEECNNDCSPGCTCNDEYILESNTGACVKTNECPDPLQCSRNETWTNCLSTCWDRFCAINDTILTACDEQYTCNSGCQCKPDYKYNATGQCILTIDCPSIKCSEPNEIWSSSPYMLNNNILSETITIPRCICAEGFMRNSESLCVSNDIYILCAEGQSSDANGLCVSDQLQDEFQCSINETWTDCISDCLDQYCSYDEITPDVCGAPEVCSVGCRCKPNYRYNATGTCVSSHDCPSIKCTKPNEIWNSCRKCLRDDCSGLFNQTSALTTITNNCAPSCVCADGFSRNMKDLCVPILSEVNFPRCSLNETPTNCVSKCLDQYCPFDEAPSIICGETLLCNSGCQCKPNYRYNKTGYCVHISDCPPVKCIRQNEIWDSCKAVCSAKDCQDILDYSTTTQRYNDCVPKCVCSKGYYRNIQGECVSFTDNTQCTLNETRVDCVSTCSGQYCPINDSLITSCKESNCKSGCNCKPSYMRNITGYCIHTSECPRVECTRPNEIWQTCKKICLTDGCQNILHRSSLLTSLISNCVPRCICAKGFTRNLEGVCVSYDKNSPLQCERPNEVFNSCLYAFNSTKTTDLSGNCTSKCVCKQGFYRNSWGSCIPYNKFQCGKNAHYRICPRTQYRTGQKFLDKCIPSCVCNNGYEMKQDGACVKTLYKLKNIRTLN